MSEQSTRPECCAFHRCYGKNSAPCYSPDRGFSYRGLSEWDLAGITADVLEKLAASLKEHASLRGLTPEGHEAWTRRIDGDYNRVVKALERLYEVSTDPDVRHDCLTMGMSLRGVSENVIRRWAASWRSLYEAVDQDRDRGLSERDLAGIAADVLEMLASDLSTHSAEHAARRLTLAECRAWGRSIHEDCNRAAAALLRLHDASTDSGVRGECFRMGLHLEVESETVIRRWAAAWRSFSEAAEIQQSCPPDQDRAEPEPSRKGDAEEEYAELSRELYLLISKGEDGIDGDNLRLRLDNLWFDLSTEGRTRMQQMSARLKEDLKG